MKSIEASGKTVESAVENALKTLGLPREQAEIEILSQGGGLFSKAKVRVGKKRTEGERALSFIEKLLSAMGKTAVTAEIVAETDESAKINIIGTDTDGIIGRHGESLDAIRYLASVAANGENVKYKRILLDCDGYREKREASLAENARRMAEKAKDGCCRVRLNPMNAADRRIVHAALNEDPEVTTSSEGEDPRRYVVITPKNFKDNRPPHKRRGHGGAKRFDNKKRRF